MHVLVRERHRVDARAHSSRASRGRAGRIAPRTCSTCSCSRCISCRWRCWPFTVWRPRASGATHARSACSAALQAISSVYYGVMTAVALPCRDGAGVVERAVAQPAVTGRGLAAAGVLGAVLIAPVAWPYWRTQQREGFGRNCSRRGSFGDAAELHAGPARQSALRHDRAAAASAAGARRARSAARRASDVPGLRAAVSRCVRFVARMAKRLSTRRAVRPRAALSLASCCRSGRMACVRFYAWSRNMILGSRRFARRRGLPSSRCRAVRACGHGSGARTLSRTRRSRSLRSPDAARIRQRPARLVAAPSRATAVGAVVEDAAGPGAVLYLPLPLDKENSTFMVQSLEHRRPMVNGYSGQRPAFYTSVVEAFADPRRSMPASCSKSSRCDIVVSPSRPGRRRPARLAVRRADAVR